MSWLELHKFPISDSPATDLLLKRLKFQNCACIDAKSLLQNNLAGHCCRYRFKFLKLHPKIQNSIPSMCHVVVLSSKAGLVPARVLEDSLLRKKKQQNIFKSPSKDILTLDEALNLKKKVSNCVNQYLMDMCIFYKNHLDIFLDVFLAATFGSSLKMRSILAIEKVNSEKLKACFLTSSEARNICQEDLKSLAGKNVPLALNLHNATLLCKTQAAKNARKLGNRDL